MTGSRSDSSWKVSSLLNSLREELESAKIKVDCSTASSKLCFATCWIGLSMDLFDCFGVSLSVKSGGNVEGETVW